MVNTKKYQGPLFEKRFPKLDFLKAVSVTMIANSEKMKIKKSHPLNDFYVFSPPLLMVSPKDFLKNCSPYPIF